MSWICKIDRDFESLLSFDSLPLPGHNSVVPKTINSFSK